MAKKFVPMNKGGKNYRLYLNDIIRIYRMTKGKRPAIPKFEDEVDYKYEASQCNDTQVQFQSIQVVGQN